MDNINAELKEENESITLSLLKNKTFRQALLTKELSLSEVVLTPRHLLEELKPIFCENNLAALQNLIKPVHD